MSNTLSHRTKGGLQQKEAISRPFARAIGTDRVDFTVQELKA